MLVLFYLPANAQLSYVQKSIDKLEQFNDFSYRHIYKQKEYTSDTLVIYHKDIFQKAPQDTAFGYMFSLETLMAPNRFPRTETYNGKNIFSVYPGDSTYYYEKVQSSFISQSLIGRLYWIKSFLEKKPDHIAKVADTTINGLVNYHFVLNLRDTIINTEHYYTRMHLLIDKLTGLPACILAKSRYESNTGGPTNYYSETRYVDYKFNQSNINLAAVDVPKGYHLPKERPALLTAGTVAPECTLYSTNNKKVSLSHLRGKVILMDFYFIGCHNCMDALKPLNSLYEKYKDQNFVIASITGRDGKKAVREFDKKNNIKYPSFVNAADVVKLYHVEAFPTFYFIDKAAKIAEVKLGYDDNFEKEATLIIDSLLKK